MNRIAKAGLVAGAGAVVAALLCLDRAPEHAAPLPPQPRALPPYQDLSAQSVAAPVPTSIAGTAAPGSLRERLLDLIDHPRSDADVAAMLKALSATDPEGLFATLMSLANLSVAARQALMPQLARASILWPEADGRFVFPIADAFLATDATAAGHWAARYLSATARSDMAVTSVLGTMAATSQDQALTLIAKLPDTARTQALQSAAHHMGIDDTSHLKELCERVDPDGTSHFSEMIFQRLAAEKLYATARWLSRDPNAAKLPGAAAAVAEGMIIAGSPAKAVRWADGIQDANAHAQAIATIYQRLSARDPDKAVESIVQLYPSESESISRFYQTIASSGGKNIAEYWAAANTIDNPSVRAYLFSALTRSMLLTAGATEAMARIATLEPGSVERIASELTYNAALNAPRLTATASSMN